MQLAETARQSSPSPAPDLSHLSLGDFSMPAAPGGTAPEVQNFLGRRSVQTAAVALAGLFFGGEAISSPRADAPNENGVATAKLQGSVKEVEKSPITDTQLREWMLTVFNPEASSFERQRAELRLVNNDPGAVRSFPLAVKLYSELAPDAPKWEREALADYIFTRKLNIEFSQRIDPDYLGEIIYNRLTMQPDGRPLAVVVNAKGDHNGAFYLGANMFKELVQAGYRVLYFEVDTDTELVNTLKYATGLGTSKQQRASILIMGGHGTQTSLHLQRDGTHHPDNHGIIDFSDEAFFRRAGLGKVLRPGGQVVLDSCSNGEGEDREENMANFVRKVFPHAKTKGIWSATESYGPIRLHFNENGELNRVEYPVPEYRAHQVRPGENTQNA